MVRAVTSVADRRVGQGVFFALAVALFCVAVFPVSALAENETSSSETSEQKPQTTQVVVNNDPAIAQSLDALSHSVSEVSQKLDKLEDVNKSVKDVDSSLDGIESKVDGLIVQGLDPEPLAVNAINLDAASQSWTVYANASPTGTYATYAKQLIPKMGWDDDYVYFQDSSSSYVLVYGPLDFRSAGTFTGSDCKYVRWYYSGSGSGYLVQSGHGDISVSVGNYVVLSNLGDYPLLDDGVTLLRQEVCFYAVVAVVLYSLHCAWSFLLRNRS